MAHLHTPGVKGERFGFVSSEKFKKLELPALLRVASWRPARDSALRLFCSTLVPANCGPFTVLGSDSRIQFWMVCTDLLRLSALDSLEKPASGRCAEVAGRATDLLGSRMFATANVGYGSG